MWTAAYDPIAAAPANGGDRSVGPIPSSALSSREGGPSPVGPDASVGIGYVYAWYFEVRKEAPGTSI